MNVTRREPEAAGGSADGPTPQRTKVDVRAEMRASPDDKNEDQRAEEMIEEPGYGHGV
jgi:hypothetical protein